MKDYRLTPLSSRPAYLRLDTYPFVLVYLLLYVFLDPLNPLPSDNYESRSLAFRLSFPCALLAHCTFFFTTIWRLSAEAKAGYTVLKPRGGAETATDLSKVSP